MSPSRELVLEHWLPALNACLNGSSCVCLLLGYGFIRRRQIAAHRRSMLAALLASSAFLVGYLTRVSLGGTHRFAGSDGMRLFYLTLLFSHMVLAVAVLPLIFRALFLASRGRFAEHRRIARWAWPIWMYVSSTGVIVYFMLYRLF